MELFGLSMIEILVIAVVAILVFGQRLPQVAGETAATLQKIKRSLADLRRETGIDQEILRAKREFEQSVRKPVREIDVPNTIRREAESAKRELQSSFQTAPLPTGDAVPPSAPAWEPTLHEPPFGPGAPARPPLAEGPSDPDRG